MRYEYLQHCGSSRTHLNLVQWDSLMAQAAQNMDVLSSMDNIKILSNVLKTNVSACTSIGTFYLPQIGRIFLDMLGLYKAVSGIISETVAREGTSCRRSDGQPFLTWSSLQVSLPPRHQKSGSSGRSRRKSSS